MWLVDGPTTNPTRWLLARNHSSRIVRFDLFTTDKDGKMTETDVRNAIEFAKPLIENRGTTGELRAAIMERHGVAAKVADQITQAAVHELYDSDSKDPMFWFRQDCAASPPLQRRFAKQKFRKLDTSALVDAVKRSRA